MSFEFQSTLVDITPNYRLGGSQIGGAIMEMIGDISTIRIAVVDDADVRFALTGPFETGDPAAIYAALSLELFEIIPGILINEGAVSSVDKSAEMLIIDFEGSDAKYRFKPNAEATEPSMVASYTWELTQAGFDALSVAASVWRSSLDGTLEGLATAINAETAARIAADAVIQADVDQNEADGDAADATLQSNIDAEAAARTAADGVLQAAIDAVQLDVDGNEADSDAAEAALSGRLDTLEADPVTKTYVDNADTTLQSNIDSEAGTRASADSALDARLDVLEADPTTATAVAAVQSDVDANEADSDAADAALSARLDVLEADPTTATAVAAVQADVDLNESDADAAIALKLDASAVSAYGLTLVDDADAATARTTLGLGTAATTDASAYATAAQGALADTAVQPAAISNVDNTSDADKPVSTAQQAALDLKANKAGDTFTGDIIIDEGTGSTIKLETSNATSAGIHIEGPTGSMGYIDTTNGFANDSLQVYSANFWVRAINGGTGNVIIDGTLTLAGTALTATFTELNQLDGVTLGTAASAATGDFATAAQGALADTAVQPAAISNIDNTSDADKPVSTAQQAALDLRALLDGTNIPGPYANDSAAATAGVAIGAIYKHSPSGALHWRVS